MIKKEALTAGYALLRQPALPLAGIVQFLFLTGDFTSVDEVIGQLPVEIETGYTQYRNAPSLLASYGDLMELLAETKAGTPLPERVIDTAGNPVDVKVATGALMAQRILTRELEQINSLLCGPCGCTLCCVGPTPEMAHAYFEIPLQPEEIDFFPVERIDTPSSRSRRAIDDQPLRIAGRDFFERSEPGLIRWQTGWSLILPRSSRCPNLKASGGCRIYPDRPQVCRRPQIFPYVVEPVEQAEPVDTLSQPVFRMRQTLMAVMDCPYVQLLHDEIAAYAAACELEMIFRHNKA